MKLTADILLDVLITARSRGTITSKKPIKSKNLIVALKELRGVVTTGRELRLTINALITRGMPICSTNKGYYLALLFIEVNPAVNYITSYIIEMEKRRKRLIRTALVLEEADSSLFEHPTIEKLHQFFNA